MIISETVDYAEKEGDEAETSVQGNRRELHLPSGEFLWRSGEVVGEWIGSGQW